jgi:hypothetical protein
MRCPIVMKISHIVRCCMTRFGNGDQDQSLIKTNMSLICPQGHSMPFASASGRTDRYKGGWRCDICNRSENRDVARYVVNFSMYRCSIFTFYSRFRTFCCRYWCDTCTYDVCVSCAPSHRRKESFADAFDEVYIVFAVGFFNRR